MNLEKGVLPQSKIFFHTSSHFAHNALFHLFSGGVYNCSNLYETNRECYNQYLFIHVIAGKMEIHFQDAKWIAEENSLIFLDCYQPHLYRALENTSFNWLHFSGNASKEYFKLLFPKNGCVFPIHQHQIIADYMTEVLNMMENNKVDEHAASILIHKILYELEKISNGTVHTAEQTIKRAIQFIESRYNQNITLVDIASHVQLSPYHFSRIFKKHMNESPYQYLINYRINYAKKLLYNTNLTIKEIAFACGYNSVSHFVTTFKQHSNLSPKQFRELQF
ncbi:helix-turn-helix domain-containing protein [Heyndrickxia ginsengihumi]|uniref:helix-turn-helix domain-containing protein n=2 Tax=Heyndrickxia ginsengihumi TaxID=363870 RepID=UPI003D1F9432